MDSIAVEGKLTLKVFDGRDFPMWKEEIKFILMSQDLWGIVTGREHETVDAENPMILSRFNARREREPSQ